MEIGSLWGQMALHRDKTPKEKLVIKERRQDPNPALLTQLHLQEGDRGSSGLLGETIPARRELVVSNIYQSKKESSFPHWHLHLLGGQSMHRQRGMLGRHCKQVSFDKAAVCRLAGLLWNDLTKGPASGSPYHKGAGSPGGNRSVITLQKC